MGPVDEPRPEAETSGSDPTPTPAPLPTPEPAPTPAPTPQPTPAPAPTPAPTPDPVIASTVSIPAQGSADQDGGEWELLVGKVKAWLEQNDLAELWTKAQLPLRVIGGLIVFALVAKVYSGVLNTIDSLPLAPGLLELAGLIWLMNFALRNLIRSSDRDKFITATRSTWSRITGRSS
ncbi:MAG: hypothetical protein GY876_04000 [Planctomycetes bacterium]|nr:hypothetical protein [Planctomycetota bacterium]